MSLKDEGTHKGVVEQEIVQIFTFKPAHYQASAPPIQNCALWPRPQIQSPKLGQCGKAGAAELTCMLNSHAQGSRDH